MKISVSSSNDTVTVTADGFKTVPYTPKTNAAKKIPYYTYPESQKDYYYSFDNAVNSMDGELVGYTRFVEKYNESSKEWTVYIEEDIDLQNCFDFNDGVLVYGFTREEPKHSVLIKISADGEQLWSLPINDCDGEVSIGAIFENSAGGYDIFGLNNTTKLYFGNISKDGVLISSNLTEVGEISPQNIIPTQTGYALNYVGKDISEHANVIILDSDGNVLNTFSYKSDDRLFFIKSMCDYEGKLLISTYSIKKDPGAPLPSTELDFIKQKYPYVDTEKSQNRELLAMLKEYYTAELLVCNFTSGAVESFYSAEGSFGGKLAITENGELLWKVECITVSYYVSKGSQNPINGSSYIYDYIFDKNMGFVSGNECNYLLFFLK